MKGLVYRIKVIFRSIKEVHEFILSRFLNTEIFVFGLIFIITEIIAVFTLFDWNYLASFVVIFTVIFSVLVLNRFFKIKFLVYILFAMSIICIRLLIGSFSESQIIKKYTNNPSVIDLYVTITKPADVNNEFVTYVVKNNSDNLTLRVRGSRYPVYIPYSICHLKGSLQIIDRSSEYFQYFYSKNIFYDVKVSSFSCEDNSSSLLWKLYSLKHATFRIIEQNMNEPYASLLIGIVWGENRSFSPKMEEAFKITGTTHVIAASGYNVNVITIILERFLYFLPKKIRVIISIFMLFLYLILAGVSASIFRAVLMYVIDRMYELLGMPVSILQIILLTVVIMMIYNPKIIYDIGFLLSMGATLGLVFFNKVLIKDLPQLPESLLTTLSANIGTLGITIYTFKVFSVISLPINSVVLSFLDNIMELGVVGIIIFQVSKTISRFIFMLIEQLLKPFVYITYSFGDLKWGFWAISPGLSLIVLITLGFISMLMTYKYFYILNNETK